MAPSAGLPDPEPEYVLIHAGKGTIRRPILNGAARKLNFETIPQVDFTRMDSPSLEERTAIAKQVGAAFRESGFCTLSITVSARIYSETFIELQGTFSVFLKKRR